LEPTPERIERITAKGLVSEDSESIEGVANWDSMRALRDPTTGETLRGSIAIYSDLRGRAVPVEVVLPDEFLAAASTRPEDVDERMSHVG
jgi:hypothetical protein